MHITGSGGHTLKRYDKDMQKLQTRVLSMGDMVHQQLHRLQEAIGCVTEETMQEIIEADDNIDRQEVKVDKFIIKVLARRSPVGSDLRFIVASSRIVTDLERLGDETAQMAKIICEDDWHLANCEDLSAPREMANVLSLVAELFDKVMDAFENYDYKSAKEIVYGLANPDGELEYRMKRLRTCSRRATGDVSDAVSLALIMRAMDRALRYIQNISEHVVYLLTATDIRHQKLSKDD